MHVCAHACVYACECSCLQSPAEGARSLGVGATGNCKSTWALGTELWTSVRAESHLSSPNTNFLLNPFSVL